MLSNNLKYYITILRPNHWFKNFVVFFGAAGAVLYFNITISMSQFFIKTCLITLFSCFISSANYLINDITDIKGDIYHPVKKNRVLPSKKVEVRPLIILILILIFLSLIFGYVFFGVKALGALTLLLFAGVVYNIHPLRFKDVPYLDVITESINNPIRILIGWHAIAPVAVLPPLEYLVLFWSSGAALMSAKRYAELRFFLDQHKETKPSLYRKSFETYTPTILYSMISFSLLITIYMVVLLAQSFNRELLSAVPLMTLLFLWFLMIVREKNYIFKEPETIILKKPFFSFSALVVLLVIITITLTHIR